MSQWALRAHAKIVPVRELAAAVEDLDITAFERLANRPTYPRKPAA